VYSVYYGVEFRDSRVKGAGFKRGAPARRGIPPRSARPPSSAAPWPPGQRQRALPRAIPRSPQACVAAVWPRQGGQATARRRECIVAAIAAPGRLRRHRGPSSPARRVRLRSRSRVGFCSPLLTFRSPPQKKRPFSFVKKNSYAAPKQKCIMRLSKLFERNQARGRGLLHLHGRPTPRAWLDTMGDVLKAFEDKKLDFDNWLKTQPPAVRAPATTPPRVSSLARNNCHVCGSKGEWRHISTGSVCCAIGRRHTNHLPTRPLPSFRRLKSASPPPQMRSKVCAARIRPRVCFRDRSEK